MYEEKIKELLSQAKENYNNKSYVQFTDWVNSFNGDYGGEIVRMIYQFIDKRNMRPSTLIWRIDKFYEDEIMKFLLNNLPQQS
ncbi:MAG: hypothetical protein M1416_00545 [Candidatus Pacearchaeota archaeon]|nr:hypothetical protein [Candidatus Pacearchaeota archaeon]